ncbi:MAG: glycoside hydrolase family 38 N-terminal domain-containing protein [Pirellulales bacterium]
MNRSGLPSVWRRLVRVRHSAIGLVLGLVAFGALPCPAAETPVREVIVVFKTHFDIGYTDPARNVVQRYRTSMIDQALDVVERNRSLPPAQQFAWTLPGWPAAKIMEDWPGQTPERKAKLQQALREGRFVVHALPFTLHTELLETEDLVRGLGYASRLSRAAGLPLPRDAKMTDVPCHAWIWPTLLRHAGVDFLHLGCNGGSHPPTLPPIFWWEGPDGSRLLTMYSFGYGTGLMPPANWPHKTWLALIHTGDNHGPPTPEEVTKLLDEARRKLPGVAVRIGRLSDFADSLLAEKPQLPVVRGDMPDTWIHGPMCNPDGAILARNTRLKIAAAEALSTELASWGVKIPDFAPQVATAYDQSLLYGEHTWGGALYWVTQYAGGAKYGYGDTWKAERAEGRFRRLEESWDEHTGYIRAAREAIAPVMDGSMKALAASVGVAASRVVVYNPLPWRRGGLVHVAGLDPQIQSLKPADANETIPVGADGAERCFLVRDVPAFGYRTYVPAMEVIKLPAVLSFAEPGTLEGPFFKVVLDPARATIRSLVDKRSGRELVDSRAPHGFGQYLYERFDADQVAAYVKAYVVTDAAWAANELGKPNLPPAKQVPYRAASPANCKMQIQQSASKLTAVFSASATPELPHAVTVRVSIYAAAPRVDLQVTLHDKPADPWPEAGWIALPLAVEEPQFRVGRQGSIIDPAKDIVLGANRHMLAVTTGVAVLDPQGRGVGLCAPDNPLVSLDQPGCWKYSLDFVPKRPAVYVNLFNNQWTTNFRFWNEGTWTSRVRIWSIDRYDPAESLVAPSLDARVPLETAVAAGPAGTLAAKQSGVEISRRGAMVTTFGPNPDGPGTVLRLWELAGQSGPCSIRLPQGMTPQSVQPVDLRGRPIGAAIPCRNGSFETPLPACAPASFVVKSESQP